MSDIDGKSHPEVGEMEEALGPFKYLGVQQHTDQIEFFHDLDEVLGYIMGDLNGNGVKCIAKIIEPVLVDRNDDRTFPTTTRDKIATAKISTIGPAVPFNGSASSALPDDPLVKLRKIREFLEEWDLRILDPVTKQLVNEILRLAW